MWVNTPHCLWQAFHCKYNATFTTTGTNKSESLGTTATSCDRGNFQKGRKVSWTGSDNVERALAEWRKFNGKYGSSGLKGRQRWNYFNVRYCFLFIRFWLVKPELFANTCCSLGRKNILTSFFNIFFPHIQGKIHGFFLYSWSKRYNSSAIASGLLCFFSAGFRVIAYALFTTEKIATILKCAMPPQKILSNKLAINIKGIWEIWGKLWVGLSLNGKI